MLPELPLLFLESHDSYRFRYDYYNMVSTVFRESFIKQMYDWCTEHNCKLTGHMMNEEGLVQQMYSTAGVMSCYEYFHEPGIDWLNRAISGPIVPKQLGSVASQLGRITLSESFALCGWDVSLNELKWIAQWQLVNGVTSFCPHLAAYSSCIYGGRNFKITNRKKKLDISKITEQDYWFFAGEIKLTQKISINKKDGTTYLVSLKKLNAPAAELFVNGNFAGILAFAPFEKDVTEFLRDGENEISFNLLSGNRNLLGPHHKPYGESYSVGPATFTDKIGWSDPQNLPTWTDDYSFVLFGIEF